MNDSTGINSIQRQYVGARYVPVFADPIEWNNQMSYEPLTIVTYLNASYTSRKQVPPGTLPTNNEYWALTGNYNGQVEQYRQDVENLSVQIDRLDDDLSTDIANLQTNINQLDNREQQSTQELQQNINQNSNQIELLKNTQHKSIILIGDSYSTNYQLETQNKPLLEQIQTNLNSEIFHVYTSAQEGAGFCSGRYLSQLQSINVPNKNAITDIYFIGGWNDTFLQNPTQELLNQNALNIKNYASSNFPNAELHTIFIGGDMRSNQNQIKLRQSLSWYKNLSVYGFSSALNSQYVMQNRELFNPDNIHPNITGVQELIKKVTECILTNTCDVIYSKTYNASINDAVELVGPEIVILEYLHNDVKTIIINGNNGLSKIKLKTPVNISLSGTKFTAFGYQDVLFHPITESGSSAFVPSTYRASGTMVDRPILFNLSINSTNIEYSIQPLTTAENFFENTYVTVNGFEGFAVPTFQITLYNG